MHGNSRFVECLPPEVRWVLRWQMRAVLILALGLALAQNLAAALGASIGGLAGMAGAWIYVWRSLRHSPLESDDGEHRAATAYRAQLAAEGWKFAVTALFFAVIFIGPVRAGLPPLPVLLGYASTSAVYWLALVKMNGNGNELSKRN